MAGFARRLEKQIFAPLLFAFAEQAHEVAAGMQAEWLGLAGQLHAGFFRGSAAFAVIA